ncbi:MAG: hypothetical protein R6W75_08350 [Smithellaceae bacterium]
MVKTQLPVSAKEHHFSSGDFPFADILSPYVHKGLTAHSTLLVRSSAAVSTSFRVALRGAEKICNAILAKAKEELSMPPAAFPYGLTEPQWSEYALSPHSYLPLSDHTYQVGLNYFNRFLHLDTRRAEACLLDPGVQDDFLSTTNWFDAETDELWFASWSAQDTIRRNINPRENVSIRIWNLSLREDRLQQVWQGDLGDSLHQLIVSPDKNFLVVAELGLRTQAPPAGPGLAPSAVLILDLKTQQTWRLELPAAAHVEFDPNDPAVCYLSGHNIGFVGPKVGIFGPGVIQKVRLTPEGPKLAGSFSHQSFHRITTHIVFNGQGKTRLAVSGYPGSIFLIDAYSMQLDCIIDMDAEDKINPACLPHVCTQDSYGICASQDGQTLLVCETGRIRALDLRTNRFIRQDAIEDDCCFTGHIARIPNTAGWIS